MPICTIFFAVAIFSISIYRRQTAWINDGSHSIPDDLHIDSFTDAVPKYHEVLKKSSRIVGICHITI